MRSKPLAIAVLLTGLGALLVFEFLSNTILDRYANSWAYASPSLMQNWAGEAASGGIQIKLVFSLARDEVDMLPQGDSNDSGRSFSGKALFCDSTGRIQPYTLRGVISDRHASALSINFSAPPSETPGLRPTSLKAGWKGGNELDAHVWLAHALANGGAMTRSSDPLTGHAIAFNMRPAHAFGCSIQP